MDSNRIINYIENKETRKKYVTRRATEFFGGPEVKYFIKYFRKENNFHFQMFIYTDKRHTYIFIEYI